MKVKRILASILALALTASSLPSQAWAANFHVTPTAPVAIVPGGAGATGAAARLTPVKLSNFALGAVPMISAGQMQNSVPALVNPPAVAPVAAVNGSVSPTASFARSGVTPNFVAPVSVVALPQSAIAPQSAGALFTPEQTAATGRFGFAVTAKRESEGARPETSFGALRATGKTLSSGLNADALAELFTGEAKTTTRDFSPYANGFAALAGRGGQGFSRAAAAPLPAQVSAFAGDIGQGESALLTAPTGERLDVRVARTPEHEERWLTNRRTLPGDGVLTAAPAAGKFDLWFKNTLVPLDFVVLDAQGLVTSVHSKIGPAPAKSHWKDIPLLPAEGMFSLALPAGRASELGAQVGARFQASAGMSSADVLDPEEAADMVLSADPYAVSAAVEDFASRARDDDRFDAVLSAVKSQYAHLERAKRPAARRALADFVGGIDARLDTQGAYEGEFANQFPLIYLGARYNSIFARILAVPFLLLDMGTTFFHEGGHWLAAKLTGIKTNKFRVFFNGAGYVQLAGKGPGWRSALVDVAGPALGMLPALLLAGSTAVYMSLYSQGLLNIPGAQAAVVGIAGAYFSYLGITLQILRSQYDWISLGHSLGLKNLAAEMIWRTEMRRQGRLRTSFSGLWLSLLTRPRLSLADLQSPENSGATPAAPILLAENAAAASRQ